MVEINSTLIPYTGVIYDYTVSTTGLYDIIAFGARGGSAIAAPGGLGAQVGGDLTLTKGTVLAIVVGGAGMSEYFGAGGGGGGSFVWETGVVPEPSTWAMMLLGFTGLGFVSWSAQRKAYRGHRLSANKKGRPEAAPCRHHMAPITVSAP